jgi:hypothetical protein
MHKTTYPGINFLPWYKTTYRGTKQHTQVQNYIPRYKTTHPGTKQHTRVQNYTPWNWFSYPVAKLHTQIQNYIPRYKTTYPGTKQHTQVQNYIPGHESTSPGTTLATQVQNFCRETGVRHVPHIFVLPQVIAPSLQATLCPAQHFWLLAAQSSCLSRAGWPDEFWKISPEM